MSSELPLKADIAQYSRHVSKVPILLQNSFGIDQHKFSGPYVRRTNNDLRNYVRPCVNLATHTKIVRPFFVRSQELTMSVRHTP
jgi:hypothetical protein